MGKHTGISWTHHTFNPWWGCEKPLVEIGGKTVVSPECVSCYAEHDDKRYGGSHWGKTAPRRCFTDKHWNEPLKWNREAEIAGERRRVFCLSMGDILEDRRDLDPHRGRLWPIMRQTEWLDWMLLTKRAELLDILVPDWVWELPNIWPGVTAGVQETANLRIPHLLALRRKYRHLIAWLSAEPLLGALDLTPFLESFTDHLDLVIVGGESGGKARPMNPEWVRKIRDDCRLNNTPFFFKQWGEWAPVEDGATVRRLGRKAAGDLLDGRRWQEIPAPGREAA